MVSKRPQQTSHSCTACRKRKTLCDRTQPTCQACKARRLDCSYPSSNSRYLVSRRRSCAQCCIRRRKCDRQEICSACRDAGLQCLYPASSTVTERSEHAEADDSAESQIGAWNLDTSPHGVGTAPEVSTYPAFLLGIDCRSTVSKQLHPPIAHIWILYQTYVENVDQLYKIFHAPSFHRRLLRTVHHLSSIDSHLETLLFSVYHAAIISLKDNECIELFSEGRTSLLRRYRYGLEQSFVRSGLLANPSIVPLQALVLFLVTSQHSPLVTPTGPLLAMAIQLAKQLNLHKEDTTTVAIGNSTVADMTSAEMRKRLWWHLIVLDAHFAEETHTDPNLSEGMWVTPMPENLDDIELDDQKELPLPPPAGCTFDRAAPMSGVSISMTKVPHDEKTDISFALLQIEMSYARRRVAFSETFCKANGHGYLATQSARVVFLENMANSINRRYLRHFQRNDMFSFFLRNAAKLQISRHLLVARTEDSDQEILRNCFNILDASATLRKTQSKWAWILRSEVELDALERLWDVLSRISPPDTMTWSLAQVCFERGLEDHLELCYADKWARIEAKRELALAHEDARNDD